MTDHAELRRVAALAHPDAEWFIARNLDHPNIDKPAASFIATANPKAVLALLDEIDRLKAENEALRGALQAVEAEVDGNLRPLTRDLVNMVSGLNNGTHPNDIYDHCDEIERIIGAALEGDKQ
ncbi:TPA: ead/Ea22-like family protein [Pseudomonas aeruginosa]